MVTGIRRCGKSYLLFSLFKKHLLENGIDENHIIEIAFDSFENKNYRNPDILYPYLKEQMTKETYINDIIGRHNIKNKDEFEELVDILSSGIGSLTNPKKLTDTFRSKKQKKISVNTVKSYLDYLCDAFIVNKAVRYDVKGRRYISHRRMRKGQSATMSNLLLQFRTRRKCSRNQILYCG